jgi:glycosyltransferase involved in cell wall biosynthesis
MNAAISAVRPGRRRTAPPRSPARVMVLVDTLAAGGAERVAVDFASNVNRRAYEPHVVATKTGGPLEEQLVAAGIPYTVLGRHRRLAPRPALRALELARGSDLIHSHLFGNNVWGALLSRSAGIPLVAHEHNRVGRHVWSERAFDRLLIGSTADYVLCVSDQVGRPLIAAGVDRTKIEVLPNGVALDDVLSRADARRELGLASTDVVIGCVASLRPEKAHDVLLRGFALIRARSPAPRLCIVGDGAERARLETYASTLGIQDRVLWAGERRNAGRLVSAFDVAVLCSRSEGLPLSALEAMAGGTPLIASRAGSLPTLLDDGAGLLVETNDPVRLASAIELLLADKALALEFAQRARTVIAERYQLSTVVKRLEDIYERALAVRSRPGRHGERGGAVFVGTSKRLHRQDRA